MKFKDKDIKDWPDSWKGHEEDIQYGEELVEIFVPFIEDLKSKKLSVKTINGHIDNLWMLGGKIIKMINYYPPDRQTPPLEMLKSCIDSGDGPLIHDFSEYEQEKFDATCRKLYKFLLESKRI